MKRCLLAAVVATGLMFGFHFTAWAQDKVGVLMLHGKNPGSNQDPNFGLLKPVFQAEGWLVAFPDMPWSRTRYLDGDWDQVMVEMAEQVQGLRAQGASKIVLVGHSMGAPAALSHAARGGSADALVLLAPGHIPRGYFHYPALKVVRESIDDARAKVAAGKGDVVERFSDINQGRQQPVITTANRFLSYFDPESDAEMGMTAPRVPAQTPVLTVIGKSDPLFRNVRGYFVDRLPPNAKTELLEVEGGHLDTPRVAKESVVRWIKSALANP